MSAEELAPDHDDGVAGVPRYRPPIGIPAPATGTGAARGWLGTLASVALHVAIVLLLLTPLLVSDAVRERVLGAGSSGPAGGGGGGNRGAGGRGWLDTREALHYVQVAPTPAAPRPAAAPVPPVPTPPPPKPPPPVPKVEPKAVPAPPAPTPAAPAAPTAAAPASGSAAVGGSGTGTDGSAGNGPGSGGGVGSGVGTGVGSGVGPGTGGDSAGGVFLPTPTETILPPFDAPASVRGQEIPVTFDIDERGAIVSVTFPPTRDGGFNRKLRERLQAYRFRPGHTATGQPVRAKFQLSLFIS